MKQQIENIIKKNLPEKKELIENRMGDYYYYEDEDWKGFNQALSQINPSLIADEVVKVVVEKIEQMKRKYIYETSPQKINERMYNDSHNEILQGIINLLTKE